MSLADQLKAPEPQPCKFALTARLLTEEDLGVLKKALADNTSSRRIARALTAEGHSISHTTVQQHRDSMCTCFRTARFPGQR